MNTALACLTQWESFCTFNGGCPLAVHVSKTLPLLSNCSEYGRLCFVYGPTHVPEYLPTSTEMIIPAPHVTLMHQGRSPIMAFGKFSRKRLSYFCPVFQHIMKGEWIFPNTFCAWEPELEPKSHKKSTLQFGWWTHHEKSWCDVLYGLQNWAPVYDITLSHASACDIMCVFYSDIKQDSPMSMVCLLALLTVAGCQARIQWLWQQLSVVSLQELIHPAEDLVPGKIMLWELSWWRSQP